MNNASCRTAVFIEAFSKQHFPYDINDIQGGISRLRSPSSRNGTNLMTKPGRSLLVSAFLQAAIIAAVANPEASLAQEVWQEDVEMFLVRASDGALRSLEDEDVTLTLHDTIVEPGDRIENLLTQRGIYADAEGFGAVYQLNPDVYPELLETGTELTLPVVQGGESLQSAFDEGYLVALTLHVGLKQRILDQVEQLSSQAPDLLGLDAQRFEEETERSTMLSAADRSIDLLKAIGTIIKERSRPLDPDMLAQISSEAEVLHSMLSELLSDDRMVTPADGAIVEAISKNMEVRSRHFVGARGPGGPPARYPRGTVTVKALSDSVEVHQLRVYYVPLALLGMSNYVMAFPTLTSPTQHTLPEADYYFWLGRPGDPTPLSEVFPKEVRRRSSDTADILELPIISE